MNIPRLRPSTHASLSGDSCHAILIALLRGLAAIEVAAAHLRAQLFPGYQLVPHPTVWFQGLAFFTGFAHQAVVMFFLLSGWLVGGSLLNKIGAPDALKIYAIDRVTRLWTVLIPCFLFMLLLGVGFGALDPRALDFSSRCQYSAFAFVGNLIGLQPGFVPAFGGDFPLWSLANETWYYILFPLLLLIFTARAARTRICSAMCAGLIAYFLSHAVLLYFSLWLLGAGFSRVRVDATWRFRLLLFSIFAAISVFYRMRGSNDDLTAQSFIQDFIYSIAFLTFLSSMQYAVPRHSGWINAVKAVGKLTSEFSFTLYVLHIPVIGAFLHLAPRLRNRLAQDDPLDWAIYFAMLLATMLLCYLFYIPFESRTASVRRRIKSLILGGSPAARPAASASSDGR